MAKYRYEIIVKDRPTYRDPLKNPDIEYELTIKKFVHELHFMEYMDTFIRKYNVFPEVVNGVALLTINDPELRVDIRVESRDQWYIDWLTEFHKNPDNKKAYIMNHACERAYRDFRLYVDNGDGTYRPFTSGPKTDDLRIRHLIGIGSKYWNGKEEVTFIPD